MRLAPVFVPVKRIQPPVVSRSEFSNDIIEKLANAILEVQGIIDPIILRRQGSEAYEIVEGSLEYYAAARAREIDLRKGEMVSAFILEGEKEEALQEQVKLLRESRSISPSITPLTPDIVSPQPAVIRDSSPFEAQLLDYHTRLTQIESRFEKRFIEMEQQHRENRQTLETRLKQLEKEKQASLPPVEALNTLKLEELVSRLKGIGIKNSAIANLVKEREASKFTSLVNIQERMKGKGIGDKTLFKICDRLLSS